MGQEIQEAEEIMDILIIIVALVVGIPAGILIMGLVLKMWLLAIALVRNPIKCLKELFD